jgi:hypothetical protein
VSTRAVGSFCPQFHLWLDCFALLRNVLFILSAALKPDIFSSMCGNSFFACSQCMATSSRSCWFRKISSLCR